MKKTDRSNRSGRTETGRPRDASGPGSPAAGRGRGPASSLRIAFLVLCIVGALLSAELMRLHVKVHTDPDYHGFCAVSEEINCEVVAASKYAVFAGLPVALWGLLGYLFMGGLSVWGLSNRGEPPAWPMGLLFWLSLFSALISIVLYAISHVLIGSFCIVCIAAYLTNFGLVGLAAASLRRFRLGPLSSIRRGFRAASERPVPFLGYLGGFTAVLLALWLALPNYWKDGITTGPGGLLVGRTESGLHWIGARKPVIEAVEFSDYQCAHCVRGHTEIRSLVGRHPDSVRLVHRNFPLRRHPHAFAYAQLAYCAGKEERFWEANDYLYKNGQRQDPVTPAELAEAVQIDPEPLAVCAASEESKTAVANDVQVGRSLGIRGTPTYAVGNQVYPGRIPETVLSALLPEEQKGRN